jgi:hypothetical protein
VGGWRVPEDTADGFVQGIECIVGGIRDDNTFTGWWTVHFDLFQELVECKSIGDGQVTDKVKARRGVRERRRRGRGCGGCGRRIGRGRVGR